jgi:LPXTG-site transpeptidase (sortase) family protein
MQARLTPWFKKARYYSSVSFLYALTLLFAFFALRPAAHSFASGSSLPLEISQESLTKPIISGRPVRIIINSLGVDLPVDEGRYSGADGTWSLSGYHAQYAMLTPLANDDNGNTFLYGHNNKYVFGPLKKIAVGAQVQVYTDNNKIFYYNFSSTYAVAPDNTSVLDYQGPSILTIQTCSCIWNEQRQMYVFSFEKVVQQ